MLKTKASMNKPLTCLGMTYLEVYDKGWRGPGAMALVRLLEYSTLERE